MTGSRQSNPRMGAFPLMRALECTASARRLRRFKEAARALTAQITDAKVEPRVRVDLSCEATDIEHLFVEMAQRRHLRDGSGSGALLWESRMRISTGRCGASRSMSRGMPRPVRRKVRAVSPCPTMRRPGNGAGERSSMIAPCGEFRCAAVHAQCR